MYGKNTGFLGAKDLKPNSKKIYKLSIKSFLKHIYSVGDGVDWEELAEQYLAIERDYRERPRRIYPKAARKTALNDPHFISAVMVFLQFNSIGIRQSHLAQIKSALPKGSRPMTRDGELTKEILQSMLTHSNIKGPSY
jgi:hypothetical protein